MHPSPLKKTVILLLEAALMLGLLFLFIAPAHAQNALGGDWDQFLHGVKNFSGITASTTGEDIAEKFIFNGIRILRNLIGAIALVLAVLYATNLVLARGNEETIATQKNNFTYMLIGFLVILSAENIARLFNPATATTDQIINFSAANDQLRTIASYMKWFLGSILGLLMTISAIRMVTSQGNEEVADQQKQTILWSFAGGLVILLADSLVRVVYTINYEPAPGTDIITAASAQSGITTVAGIIQLMLAFLGPVAVIFTIYAGFLYMTAFQNEEQTGKAKQMIIGGITGIVVVYAAYAIVSTFFLNAPNF